MYAKPEPRRRQFSSCDGCRASRLRCDALKTGLGSCSRCSRRNRPCTFNWISEFRGSAAIRPQPLPPCGVSTPTDSVNLQVDPFPDIQSTQRAQKALWIIYLEFFDQVLGELLASLVAEHSQEGKISPFQFSPSLGSSTGNNPRSPTISVLQSCILLDAGMGAENDCADIDWGNATPIAEMISSQNSLPAPLVLNAIYAFSARWLPLTRLGNLNGDFNAWYGNMTKQFWRNTRQDMLKAVNKMSYCSVLAMFLFALTPVPCDISNEEENNGLLGHTCLQIALQKLQTLRAWPKTLQFSTSKSPNSRVVRPDLVEADTAREKLFLFAESCVYWTGVILDTAMSLTLDCQPILCAGLLGFHAEPSLELIRRKSELFQSESILWLQNDFELTDEIVLSVIGTTAAWKLYTCKKIAVFKEALRNGFAENYVKQATNDVFGAIDYFRKTYRPALDACEKKLDFLSWKPRFEWYLVTLHYYLGILLFVESAETLGGTELFDPLALLEARKEAVQGLLTSFKYGLGNSLTPAGLVSIDEWVPENTSAYRPLQPTTSFVAWDPYPHHTVAAVKLVSNAVSADFSNDYIGAGPLENTLFTLLSVMRDLPLCSKFVESTRQLIADEYHMAQRGQYKRDHGIFDNRSAVLV